MHICKTCGKECPTPFAIDVGNGWYYCSSTCYVNSLLKKPQKGFDDYPDNSRDDMPFNYDDGC